MQTNNIYPPPHPGQQQQQQPLPPIRGNMPQQGSTANSAAGHAAGRAGAYGGSEAGSLIGGMVGPPIIGSVVGNIVGERVGGQAIKETGLDKAAVQVSDDIAKVVGRQRADKVGEIAMTALGYSEAERCLCCPCMPQSQIMFFVMLIFFIFNCSRLGIGIDFDASCTNGLNASQTLVVQHPPESDNNATDVLFEDEIGGETNSTDIDVDDFWVISSTNSSTKYLVAYPCQFGFHYLLAGAAVWVAFLPFHIMTLFGNCYRQCCCCLCDPIVCCATLMDCFKRCCCECGSFSVTALIWYGMCVFQFIWACMALYWFVPFYGNSSSDYRNYDLQGELINTLIASISLDLFLSGSELVHKLRLWHVTRETKKADAAAAAEGTEMTNAAGRGSAYVAPQQQGQPMLPGQQPMRPVQPGYQGQGQQAPYNPAYQQQQRQPGPGGDGHYWA